jgi:hypothetical protein
MLEPGRARVERNAVIRCVARPKLQLDDHAMPYPVSRFIVMVRNAEGSHSCNHVYKISVFLLVILTFYFGFERNCGYRSYSLLKLSLTV